jgi:hypothetical protein
VPNWPDRRDALVGPLAKRSRVQLRSRSERAAARAAFGEITGNAVGGSRLDTLVCDGFLPLLAARGFNCAENLWLDWYPGDQPPVLVRTLRELDLGQGHGRPLTNGLCQGFLGWLIEQDCPSNR